MPLQRKAFTLLELLVVIAIMFLLITLAIAAFGGVRASANRTASVNSLRQMAAAFNSYAADFNGRFMPGYLAESTIDMNGDPQDINIVATLPSGKKLKFDNDNCDNGICDRSSWVWRLSPYVGNAWETFYDDYRNAQLMTKLNAEFEGEIFGPASAGPTDIGISENPSFGMNSVFIGGDSRHGGTDVTDYNPWSPADPNSVLAATRLTEVKNPARIILFAACMRSSDAPGPDGSEYNLKFGSPELRPPYLDFELNGEGITGTRQWEFGSTTDTRNVIVGAGGDFTNGGGWPVSRWGSDLVPVTHLDGSAEVVNRFLMGADGSMWSRHVLGPARAQD